MTGARREPERSCVGCRGKSGKSALLRIARAPHEPVVDVRGDAGGRGAYVHRDRSCVEAATRKGAMARALRTGMEPGEVSRLRRMIERELGEA